MLITGSYKKMDYLEIKFLTPEFDFFQRHKDFDPKEDYIKMIGVRADTDIFFEREFFYCPTKRSRKHKNIYWRVSFQILGFGFNLVRQRGY